MKPQLPKEIRDEHDSLSGVRVRQLTAAKGHSNHAYFTHAGWVDNGRALVFFSDRDNSTELCRVDLESGAITMLTDTAAMDAQGDVSSCHSLALNPGRPEAYIWVGNKIFAVGLAKNDFRPMFTLTEGFGRGIMGASADGRYLCFSTTEDCNKYLTPQMTTKTERRQAILAAKPLSRVYKIAVDDAKTELIHEERYLIGHVNTSPTLPEVLTFCHEGPWGGVDQRVWGLNISTGERWPIRIRNEEYRTAIGHEYWLADGEHIGFHGQPVIDPRNPDAGRGSTLGCIRHDNTDHVEFRTPGISGHTHSLDFRRIVGDGRGVIRLWERQGEKLSAPRYLCEHATCTGFQRFHPHPAFTPDGRRVVFTSSRTGYSQIYLADVPEDISALPPASTEM